MGQPVAARSANREQPSLWNIEEMATNNNLMDLTLVQGRPHQLKLRRINDQDAERRVAVCTPAINHINRSRATGLFNGMDRNCQIAALLIEEEEGSHERMDAFMRAALEFQH